MAGCYSQKRNFDSIAPGQNIEHQNVAVIQCVLIAIQNTTLICDENENFFLTTNSNAWSYHVVIINIENTWSYHVVIINIEKITYRPLIDTGLGALQIV